VEGSRPLYTCFAPKKAKDWDVWISGVFWGSILVPHNALAPAKFCKHQILFSNRPYFKVSSSLISSYCCEGSHKNVLLQAEGHRPISGIRMTVSAEELEAGAALVTLLVGQVVLFNKNVNDSAELVTARLERQLELRLKDNAEQVHRRIDHVDGQLNQISLKLENVAERQAFVEGVIGRSRDPLLLSGASKFGGDLP
jgi:hypothetical protein